MHFDWLYQLQIYQVDNGSLGHNHISHSPTKAKRKL